jgi:hypothetical protein
MIWSLPGETAGESCGEPIAKPAIYKIEFDIHDDLIAICLGRMQPAEARNARWARHPLRALQIIPIIPIDFAEIVERAEHVF